MKMLHHETYIAGVKFRPGAEERLGVLHDGAPLSLERDPENQHDPNAVKVLHDGAHVGFVPRDLAAEVGGLIRAGRVARAVKRNGNRMEIYFTE